MRTIFLASLFIACALIPARADVVDAPSRGAASDQGQA
jgi:hypothetical protein